MKIYVNNTAPTKVHIEPSGITGNMPGMVTAYAMTGKGDGLFEAFTLALVGKSLSCFFVACLKKDPTVVSKRYR